MAYEDDLNSSNYDFPAFLKIDDNESLFEEDSSIFSYPSLFLPRTPNPLLSGLSPLPPRDRFAASDFLVPSTPTQNGLRTSGCFALHTDESSLALAPPPLDMRNVVTLFSTEFYSLPSPTSFPHSLSSSSLSSSSSSSSLSSYLSFDDIEENDEENEEFETQTVEPQQLLHHRQDLSSSSSSSTKTIPTASAVATTGSASSSSSFPFFQTTNEKNEESSGARLPRFGPIRASNEIEKSSNLIKKNARRIAAMRFLTNRDDTLKRDIPHKLLEPLSHSSVEIVTFGVELKIKFPLEMDIFVHSMVNHGVKEDTSSNPTNTIFRWYSDSKLPDIRIRSRFLKSENLVERSITLPRAIRECAHLQSLYSSGHHEILLAHLSKFFQEVLYKLLGESTHQWYEPGFRRTKARPMPIIAVWNSTAAGFVAQF